MLQEAQVSRNKVSRNTQTRSVQVAGRQGARVHLSLGQALTLSRPSCAILFSQHRRMHDT